jgi:hypothetical protein
MTWSTREQDEPRPRWTFMTNHAAALLHVAEHPDSTIREVAGAVGVTERAAARILKDLRYDGYLEVVRVGRRNAYNVDLSRPLRRHPHLEVELLLGRILEVRRAEARHARDGAA